MEVKHRRWERAILHLFFRACLHGVTSFSVYPLYYVLEMEASSCLETRRSRYKLRAPQSRSFESKESGRRRRNERKKRRAGSSLMKADRGAVVLVRALVRLAPSRVGVKWSRRLEDLSNNVGSAKNVRRDDTKVQLRVAIDVFAMEATPFSYSRSRRMSLSPISFACILSFCFFFLSLLFISMDIDWPFISVSSLFAKRRVICIYRWVIERF